MENSCQITSVRGAKEKLPEWAKWPAKGVFPEVTIKWINLRRITSLLVSSLLDCS